MRLILEAAVPDHMNAVLGVQKVFHISGSNIRAVRILSQQESSEYRSALRDADSVSVIADSYSSAQDNYHEFCETLGQLETLRDNEPGANELGHDLSLAVNRRLSNFLSSYRGFLDHCEWRIKHRYGHKSDQALTFSSGCSAIYDRSFPYRFAYKLRNYSQHFGFPIHHMTATAELDPIEGTASYGSTASFDVEALLSHDSDIWGTLIGELQAGPPLLPVGALVADVALRLREVYELVVSIETPLFNASVSKIIEIQGEQPPRPMHAVVGNWENDGGRLALRFDMPLVSRAS